MQALSQSNQIKSFLLVYGAVKTSINDQGGAVWVYGKGHKGVSFCVGGCVLREWVVDNYSRNIDPQWCFWGAL